MREKLGLENGRGSPAQVDETGAATTPGLWSFVAASMIDGETGWKSSLTDGVSVLQNADLRFFAIPMDGYEAAGWKVTETAPDGTATDIHERGRCERSCKSAFERVLEIIWDPNRITRFRGGAGVTALRRPFYDDSNRGRNANQKEVDHV